jgi:hypothetical protein
LKIYNFPVNNYFFHGEGISYLHNNFNGILIEDNNINELIREIESLLTNPDRLNELRLNAFETVKNECSVEIMYNGFKNVFNYLKH